MRVACRALGLLSMSIDCITETSDLLHAGLNNVFDALLVCDIDKKEYSFELRVYGIKFPAPLARPVRLMETQTFMS